MFEARKIRVQKCVTQYVHECMPAHEHNYKLRNLRSKHENAMIYHSIKTSPKYIL
jgi:hypothetical protein